ncbi:Protein phosphatase 2C homolog 1 [Galdieria sulphuraria]|uniref:Protein phosphatase n=1 Tax=Galdieria sulphuraria TaxID=130081 RepID=M2W265_GALSU|nr:protein phosphatase [Galdieria sulphuraria]EME29786.1 protein phosphatase [Galdieria sulphuraria]GJD06774.1 Protein phosphatase 2C homolog 1 [Galdieria sulphuraria]|eukprot:XP_005706306.1 protein phosphatase [Galdieria sulphuraria]
MEETDSVEDSVFSSHLTNNVEDSAKSSLTMRSRNRPITGFHREPQYCGAVHSVGFAEEANHRFRPTMEDAHVVVDEFAGNNKDAFFGVYDGHGGRAAVEVIEMILHKFLEEELEKTKGADPAGALAKAYLRADKILEEKHFLYVGATAVTCYIKSYPERRVLFCANVGDSRAVLSRNGKATRLSYDHKASDALEVDRITKDGGFIIMKRVNGVLSVSRALGDHAMKSVVIGEPHVTSETLTADDKFLILACDGLWDVVEDQEVVNFVQHLHVNGLDVQSISERLVRLALDRGSTDNISVMVIDLS